MDTFKCAAILVNAEYIFLNTVLWQLTFAGQTETVKIKKTTHSHFFPGFAFELCMTDQAEEGLLLVHCKTTKLKYSHCSASLYFAPVVNFLEYLQLL